MERTKVVIVVEGGIVKNVAGPNVDFYVIDRDEEAIDPVLTSGWQPAGTHEDLKNEDPEAFKLAFEEE